MFITLIFPRSYPYFSVAVRFACSNDPESNADGIVATSNVSNTVGVKCDDPDKKGYHGPPGWWVGGWGREGGGTKANNLTSVKRTHCWEFQ